MQYISHRLFPRFLPSSPSTVKCTENHGHGEIYTEKGEKVCSCTRSRRKKISHLPSGGGRAKILDPCKLVMINVIEIHHTDFSLAFYQVALALSSARKTMAMGKYILKKERRCAHVQDPGAKRSHTFPPSVRFCSARLLKKEENWERRTVQTCCSNKTILALTGSGNRCRKS